MEQLGFVISVIAIVFMLGVIAGMSVIVVFTEKSNVKLPISPEDEIIEHTNDRLFSEHINEKPTPPK